MDISQRVNVISDNEVEMFLSCTGREENDNIFIQVLEENENSEKCDRGKLKVEETKTSVKFDINENLCCWVGPFGMKSIYPYNGIGQPMPFSQAKEVALLMKDGSKIVVYSVDEDINTGCNIGADGTIAKADYVFEEIVDVSNIKSLQVDDNVYEIAEVNID